jgi:hypothetical protein
LAKILGGDLAADAGSTDLGSSQSLIRRATPVAWAHFLPSYGTEQIVMNGILAHSFDAPRSLLIALAWLAAAVAVLLRHTTRTPPAKIRP